MADNADKSAPSYHQTQEDPSFNADDAANDIIAQIAGGQDFDQFADAADIPIKDPDAVDDDDEIQLPPVGDLSEDMNPKPKKTPPKSEPEAETEEPAVKRGFEKLIEKETALAVREQRLIEMEAKYKDIEPVVGNYQKAVEEWNGFKQNLASSPSETLRKFGVDPDVIIPLAIAEKMGDKAPPELRRQLENARRDAKERAMEERISRFEEDQRIKEYWDSQYSVLTNAAKDENFSKHAPLVQKLAKKDVHKAVNAIIKEVREDAEQQRAAGKQVNLMTYADAAKRIHERYAEWAELGGTSEGNAANPSANRKVPNTNEGGGTQNKGVSTPKPQAGRPIRPWQKKEDIDLDEAGILAGIAAARDVEHKRRAARA